MHYNHINKFMRLRCHLIAAILSAAILTPCFSSCTDELIYPDDGDYEGQEISVPVSLTVLPLQSENPKSRAIEYIEPSDDEKEIHDFWIIEYNEEGIRAGLPRYYEKGEDKELPHEIKIIVPRREGDKYTCVLIANSNDPDLFNANNRSKFSTLDELRKFELSTHNHEHVFDPTHNKYLLMSGWTTITTDPETHHLHFDLIRNVCKVHVELTAFPTDALSYKYFQWRDVPLGKAFPHGNIKYEQSVSRDWRQHQDDDPDNDLKFDDLCNGIDFYIPCNVWLPEGPKMPGNNLTKSDVTEDPTHFVVVAREILTIDEESGDTVESGEQYEFCLYPSMNKEEQFTFQPNHIYKLEMAINGLPDYEENEFVNLIEYTYLPESNCYMMRRDSKEFFAVPITRINRYWSKFSEDGSELVDEDTDWVAEVIWQDSPMPILELTSFRRFQAAKDKSYLVGKGNLYTTIKGEYVENQVPFLWDAEGNELEDLPMCWAFRTTGSGEGNVVIGVRKKDPKGEPTKIDKDKREYLWSWHIWITDYNPEAYVPGYSWIYQEVPGGQVQRYPDSGMVGSDEWDDDWPCVMDRNLGATTTLRTREEAEAFNHDVANGNWDSRIDNAIHMFGLYYQFGRKDPFPYANQPVYDIKGNTIDVFSKNPNMIISEPLEAAPPKGPAAAFRKRASGKKVTRIDEEYAGYDPYPVRLAIKYPYKFYACGKDVKMGDLENWKPDDGEKKLEYLLKNSSWTGDTTGFGSWMSPGIESYSGKNLFDPCPVGWVMPAINSFFGEVSTDTNVDYLEAIYSTNEEGAYYTGTLLLYDLAKRNEFAYFPACGSRDGTNGKGPEGPEGNIWRVGLTNYLWTIGRYGVSMGAAASNFGVAKEGSLGVPIRCMREFPQ